MASVYYEKHKRKDIEHWLLSMPVAQASFFDPTWLVSAVSMCDLYVYLSMVPVIVLLGALSVSLGMLYGDEQFNDYLNKRPCCSSHDIPEVQARAGHCVSAHTFSSYTHDDCLEERHETLIGISIGLGIMSLFALSFLYRRYTIRLRWRVKNSRMNRVGSYVGVMASPILYWGRNRIAARTGAEHIAVLTELAWVVAGVYAWFLYSLGLPNEPKHWWDKLLVGLAYAASPIVISPLVMSLVHTFDHLRSIGVEHWDDYRKHHLKRMYTYENLKRGVEDVFRGAIRMFI